MAEINQFGSAKPVRSGAKSGGLGCAQCEAMLTDFIDGVLSAKDKAAFELHLTTCSECSQMLADAQRGASLLEMLKSPRPEPSSLLLERIIAQTSGQASGFGVAAKSHPAGVIPLPSLDGGSLEIHSIVPSAPVAGVPTPVFSPAPSNVLQFPARKFSLRSITNTLMQPRLAMTAAMAFFSIALTMNLTGVKLSELRASDLTPTNLKRSFYHADASVVRYYTNLRVVYELESRVRDLQRSNESDNASPAVNPSNGSPAPNGDSNKDKPEDKDQPRKPSPKSGSGTSQRRGPLDQQFKLAGASRQGMSGRSASLATVAYPQVAVRKDKSKETLQEGDLV